MAARSGHAAPAALRLVLCLGLRWVPGHAQGSIIAGDKQLSTWGRGAATAVASPNLSRTVSRSTASPPKILLAKSSGANGSSSIQNSWWVISKQAACEGKEIRYAPCRQAPCNHNNCTPEDCEVSDWSGWSDGDCTGLCVRQRGIAHPNNECGLPCNVSLIETKRCITNCNPKVVCPKGTDCQWDDWTQWSACTCSCGGGQKTRDRQIKVAPKGDGKKCPAEVKSEMVPCNTQPCGAQVCMDGSWGDWSVWGACSAACGGGLQWRTRKVLAQASQCGKPVQGNDRELRYCNSQGCSADKDCQFSAWTQWGACSCSCDGVKRRSRRIDAYGKGKGRWCLGNTKEVAPCSDITLLEGPGPGCTMQQAAVDCSFSDWSAWGKCSATCGYGQHARQRRVNVEAKNFGLACKGALQEVGRCEDAPCVATPVSAKPCIWGIWQDWGSCDKCGGQRKRFRLILQMPEDGGQPCQPQASEETGQCPRSCGNSMYCTWGDWRDGACSVTCGVGNMKRERRLVASATPPKTIRLYEEAQALQQPAAAVGVAPHGGGGGGREGVFLGLAGGCLLTLVAQWSWRRVDAQEWAARAAGLRRGSGRVASEEEVPLFQPRARGQGEWMPVDMADPDFN